MEELLLRVGVLDDGLDHQRRRHEVLDDGYAPQHLIHWRAALFLELREAPAHRVERTVGRTRLRVVQRHVPAGRGDNLRDPTAHLPSAHDEDVFELHGASLKAGVRPPRYTSISSASPWPPPLQIAARPRPPPLRRS